MAKPNIERKVHYIDVSSDTLGRISTKIAGLLVGKHKSNFQPHIDNGDIVIVENIDKIKVTGKKMEKKKYNSFSGYPGGLKTKLMKKIMAENPFFILRQAVLRMLPKNKTQDKRIKRLRVK